MTPKSIFEEAYGRSDARLPGEKESNTLNGTVEELIYVREDTGFVILALEGDDGGLYTALGVMPDVTEGDLVRLRGKWEQNARYGRQFRVSEYERELPSDVAAIERYLASGAVRGIRLKTAHKIVAQFGEDTFDVIENHPDWLAEVPGITAKQAQEISESFKKQSDMRGTVMFFRDYFGPELTMRIYKRFGSDSVETAKKNPYSLCGEVQGIGFDKADALARSLGCPQDSPERVECGVRHVLTANAAQNGHVCLPEDKLTATAASLLGVPESAAAEAVSVLVGRGELVAERDGERRMIYDETAYADEKYIAKKLCLLDRKCIPIDAGDIDGFINKEEMTRGIRYADAQRRAIADALIHGVMVLTGGPGTGKTTVVHALLDIFDSMGLDAALAAPTGRAAKRLSEATSHEARTVHRLLEAEYDGTEENGSVIGRRLSFRRCEKDLLDEHVIIIDEASMLDSALTAALLRAIKPGARLIIIGDSDQLPSVGAGNVLHDIIDSGVFATVCLTEIFRQAQRSLIVTNAHAIDRGEMPVLDVKDRDFFFLPRSSDAEIAATVADLCANRLPAAYGAEAAAGIQVITPSRRGAGGTSNLNSLLQRSLNPGDGKKRELRFRDIIFRTGDKVMQMRNNYELEWERGGKEGMGIFNGDIGVIESINPSSQSMTVNFDDRIVDYSFSSLDDLELAYAITVHKSQGSEYPIVIIPMYGAPEMLLTRNLFYTAVTRAQRMVILVGRRDIVQTMVENKRQMLRYTGLCRRLAAAGGS